jgi:hypothetical protein
MPSWNLFNEVQATVVGNIMAARNLLPPERFQKFVDRPQSFYADEAIDLGARAAEKLFLQAFKNGGAMAPSFPKDFVAALQAKMGPLIESPALQLRSMVAVAEENSQWPGALWERLRAWSMWSYSPSEAPAMIERLNTFDGLSAVAMVRADRLQDLAPLAPALNITLEQISEALGASRAAVLVSYRTPKAYTFVLVVKDDRAMDGLIAALPYCTLAPGVCVRIQ